MKDYTYKNKEIEIIRHLVDNPPKKIWWNFDRYVFDYGSYHFVLHCVDSIADSQNKFDEAIIAELSKKSTEYKPTEHSELVCENKKIDKAYIVRTFLYFTTFREYSKPEKLANKAKYKIKSLLKGKKNHFEKLYSESYGGNDEIVCHPKSEQIKDINPDYANLLDIGLLLEIDGKYLRAYLEGNGYGFHIWNDKFFFALEDIKEDEQFNEFIEIGNKE